MAIWALCEEVFPVANYLGLLYTTCSIASVGVFQEKMYGRRTKKGRPLKLPDNTDLFYLQLKVVKIITADQKEVIKAVAERASWGIRVLRALKMSQ